MSSCRRLRPAGSFCFLLCLLSGLSDRTRSESTNFIRQNCSGQFELAYSGTCASFRHAAGFAAHSPREATQLCARENAGAVLRIHTQADLDSFNQYMYGHFPALLSGGMKVWTGLVYVPAPEVSLPLSPAKLKPQQQRGQWFWLDRSPAAFHHDAPLGMHATLQRAVEEKKHCVHLVHNTSDANPTNHAFEFQAGACDDASTYTACSFAAQVTQSGVEFTVLQQVGDFESADSLCRQHGSVLVTLNTAEEANITSEVNILPSEIAWTGAHKVPTAIGTNQLDYYWASGHAWGAASGLLDLNANHVGPCMTFSDEGGGFRLRDSLCTGLPLQATPAAICKYDPMEMDFMQCPFGYLRWGRSCYSMSRARSENLRGLEYFQEQCAQDSFAFPLTLHSADELDWVLERFFTTLANSSLQPEIVLGREYGYIKLGALDESRWMWIDGDLFEAIDGPTQDAQGNLPLPVSFEDTGAKRGAVLRFIPGATISPASIADRSVLEVFGRSANLPMPRSTATICKLPIKAARKCSPGWIPLFGKCYAVTSHPHVDRKNADPACHALGGVLSDGGLSLERRLLSPVLRSIPRAADGLWVDIKFQRPASTYNAISQIQAGPYTLVDTSVTLLSNPAGKEALLIPQLDSPQFTDVYRWDTRPPSDYFPALCVRYEAVSCPGNPANDFGTVTPGQARDSPYRFILHQESW